MTTATPRTIEIIISCPSHLQEVALADLSQDLERELAALQAEVKRLRDLLNRAINEIEKTPFHTPKLTAFTAHRLADRYREKMTNTSTKPIESQKDDK